MTTGCNKKAWESILLIPLSRPSHCLLSGISNATAHAKRYYKGIPPLRGGIDIIHPTWTLCCPIFRIIKVCEVLTVEDNACKRPFLESIDLWATRNLLSQNSNPSMS